MRRGLRRSVAIAVAAVIIGFLWFGLQVFPIGGSGKETIVAVRTGDSLSTIAETLHRDGILASPVAFRVDLLLQGGLSVQPGYYQIPAGASFFSIRSILSGGPNATVLAVRPGLTLNEIGVQLVSDEGSSFAATFAADAAAAAAQSPYHPNGSLEGLIGPGEYVIAPGETPGQLLAAMQASFAAEAQAAGLSATTTRFGLSAYQLVVGASIVEKEGYYRVNMPKVARVIVNRLAVGQPLQMDSTVLYALHQDGGTVTPAMLRIATPYNTYLRNGLTPTPICTVSLSALQAMVHPPVGPWRYFVLVNRDGTMAFSTTFAQQLANEALAASRGLP